MMSQIQANPELRKIFKKDHRIFAKVRYVRDEVGGPNKYKLLIMARITDRDW
jgi:hypothetical protein